jgi:hypothetical protein
MGPDEAGAVRDAGLVGGARLLKSAAGLEQIAQVVVCRGEIRGYPQCLAVVGFGLVEAALFAQRIGQVVVHPGRLGRQSEGLAADGFRLHRLAQLLEHRPEVVECQQVPGFGPHSAAEVLDCPALLPDVAQDTAEAVVRLGQSGGQVQGASIDARRLLALAVCR